QQLAGVVPLVEGLVGVNALVALQANQFAPEHRGDHFGKFGLADAYLAFEQEGSLQGHRYEHRRRQSAVREVVTPAQRFGKFLDGTRVVHRAISLTSSGGRWAAMSSGARGVASRCG